jgi:septum site-determining protein MinD
MGCERRVVYDFVNVIHGEASLKQALIKDKRYDCLFVLAASQTRDKDALTKEGVEKVLKDLGDEGFDYIVCDSPAGIEKGAFLAMYFADKAVVVVNPEVSSVRDSDRIVGAYLLLTRYSPSRVEAGEMLSILDVEEVLGLKTIGVIPESGDVLNASNKGEPVIMDAESNAGQAYDDAVARIMGEDRPMRFTQTERKGFFSKLFGG